MEIYHVTGFVPFRNLIPGDIVTLIPGPRCAEGLGVYFSEGTPRPSAADGAIENGPQAIFEVEVDQEDVRNWWRSKAWRAKKFGKPRTWHSNGANVALCVMSRIDGDIPVMKCKMLD